MSFGLSGFRIIDKIHTNAYTSVYQAIRESDDQVVAIKTLNKEYPSVQHVAEMWREYHIAKKLAHIDGVIDMYSVETTGNGNIAIVMEYFGISLTQFIQEQAGTAVPLDQFFKIAINLAKVIGNVHDQRIVHADVVPNNILLNPANHEIRMIDMGFSSELSNERQDFNNYKQNLSSLPYISPEQTGRMNRDMDYRSDYYSMGISFYQMLTAKLPFAAENVMGWVHSHISKLPTDPKLLNQDVPDTVSNIILKLIAKNAEDRYQSAFGLISDLQRCEKSLAYSGGVELFELGKQDISEHFKIPQKLYGRENQLAILMGEFEKILSGTTEISLVSGYSGIGKSALINEVGKSIIAAKGSLIQGKFDQFQRNTPYYAITMAFKSVIRQLLSESREQLDIWKKRILDSLGANAQILVDLLPELEQVIGQQAAVAELPAAESQVRFQISFIKFVKLFANQDNPLVVFLDDLQWSDVPTLNLIQRLLASRELSHLFIIGAYRSNEVKLGHPLLNSINQIQKFKSITNLELEPLSEESVRSMAADTLHGSVTDVAPLARVLYQKSEGNPFFINALLNNLYSDGSIKFSSQTGSWEWDMQAVSDLEMTGDVVEFVVSNLRKLPIETQHLLQLAACIGNSFELRTLAIINECSIEKTSAELADALNKNVLIPLDQSYKFIAQELNSSVDSADSTRQKMNPRFKFQHDRIQQAAYALIDSNEKQKVHLTIGRLMQKHSKPEEFEEHIIKIVDHLNAGNTLINDQNERTELARLNLKAGIKAQYSAAYQSALAYLSKGLELLSDDPWKNNYDLVKQLNIEYTQCAYLTGQYDEAESRLDNILNKVITNLEKAELLSMRTRQYATIGKMQESIQAAITGLALVGVKMSSNPSSLAVKTEMLKVKRNLGKRKIPELLDGPNITDPEIMIALSLLMEIFPAAFLSGTGRLFPYLILKSVNISLRNGNSPESAFAYAAYGMLLCGELEEPEKGFEYGKLGVAMNDQLNDMALKSRILYVYAMFIHHWSKHWSSMTPWFKKGIEAGYQSGDLLYLAYSAQDCVIWDPALDLETVCNEQLKYLEIVKDCEYQDSLDSGTLFLQLQMNFRGLTDGLYSLNDDSFDEEKCVKGMRQRKFMTGIANYQIYKTEIYFAYENYTRALEMVTLQDQMIASSMSLPQMVRYSLVAFMTLSALLPEMPKKEQKLTLKRLNSDLQTMTKWALNCPENFLHIQFMMEAELARHSHNAELAMRKYSAAIESALTNEFRRDAALANELYAKFYLQLEQQKAAAGYLKAAHYLYHRLGAKRKVEHMEELYPALQEIVLDSENKTVTGIRPSNEMVDSATMDLSSVMQASKVISGEIVLNQLLKTVMKILLENAGGQKGYFVRRTDGHLFIEAKIILDSEEIELAHAVPVECEGQLPVLPVSVINYSLRTGTHVVLEDASQASEFAEDPYIIQNQPHSVICIPIIRKGQFERVIYMENNIANGAFTEGRVEVIKLLSEQASISIENAQLYDNLEIKVQERTHELMRALDDLKVTQSQLVQSEKMAGLGSLVAGVAHEINNPTNFVSIGASTLDEDLKEFKELLFELLGEDNDAEVVELFNEKFDRFFFALENIKEGTSRIKTIVLDLRTFSRLDESDKKTVPLVENLESTLRLIDSQYRDSVEFICDFKDNPEIDCFPAQLNQVFMNIMINSCHAIIMQPTQETELNTQKPKGTLTISTEIIKNEIRIQFIDTGIGMSEAVQQKIFEPFFTTKEVGEGTGMGMSISYQIIEKHDGRIEIESQEGQGTTISVLLPI